MLHLSVKNGLQAILGSETRLLEIISEELIAIRNKYADERRTRFEEATGDLTILDLIADEEQVITLSVTGYIKRTGHSEYSMQRRGGFGKKGMKTRQEDQVNELFTASTHSHLLIFTTKGQVFKVPVYTIPETSRTARGTPIVNLVNLDGDDEIAAVISVRDFDEEVDLFFCSKKGLVKRTRLRDYRNIRTSGLRAYDCAEGDELLSVRKTRTEQHVIITTRLGKCIRFQGINENGELEVRHMGRVARGVRGIKLKEADEIAGLEMLRPMRICCFLPSQKMGMESVQPSTNTAFKDAVAKGSSIWSLMSETDLLWVRYRFMIPISS